MKKFLILNSLTASLATLVSAQMLPFQIEKLPEDLAKKTILLNPEYAVFGKGKVTKDEKLPLVIFLHGAGGSGTEIRRVVRQSNRFLMTIQSAGEKCFCVAPQALKSSRGHRKKGGWIAEDLDVLLGHLKKTLPVDEKRIYLTGTSMGGYGTYVWAAKSPDHFAAIAPIVGGLGPGGPKDVTKDLDKWGKNLAKIPIRAYYGENDAVVPADRGAMILKAIEKAGGKHAEVIVIKGQGHGAGRVAFRDVKFVNWLFSQKKK